MSATLSIDDRARGRMWAALVVVFLDGAGFGLLVPLLPFVVLEFGGSAAIVTQLVAVYALASFFGGLIAGELSDRVGRVRIVKLTLVGSLVAYAAILATWSLAALFILRALAGLMTGRDGVLRALATDAIASGDHARRIGSLAAAFAIGSACGPSLTSLIGWLAPEPATQFRYTFIAAIVLTLTALALMQWTWGAGDRGVREAGEKGGAHRSLTMLGDVRAPLILIGLGSYAYAVILSVTALFGYATFGWTALQTGGVITGIALSLALSRIWLVPWASTKWGVTRTLLAAIVLGVLALAGVATAAHPPQFVISVMAAAVGASTTMMLGNVVIAGRADPGRRGFLLGAAEALSAVALFFGASLNGILFETIGPWSPYVLAAAALALCLGVTLALERKAR